MDLLYEQKELIGSCRYAIIDLGSVEQIEVYEENNIERVEMMSLLAIRVSKPDGVMMVAFLSVYSILYNNYLFGNFQEGIEENFDVDLQVKHFTEQVFTGFDIQAFEEMFSKKPVQKIALAGTDSVWELVDKAPGMYLSNEDFRLFSQYHLKTCEKRELLGTQTHLLYICRKSGGYKFGLSTNVFFANVSLWRTCFLCGRHFYSHMAMHSI